MRVAGESCHSFNAVIIKKVPFMRFRKTSVLVLFAIAPLSAAGTAHAGLVASENFAYTDPLRRTGIGVALAFPISGLIATGSGLKGTWAATTGAGESLYVYNRVLQRSPNHSNQNASASVLLNTPYDLSAGPLFIKYDYTWVTNTGGGVGQATRMDISFQNVIGGQGAYLGSLSGSGKFEFAATNSANLSDTRANVASNVSALNPGVKYTLLGVLDPINKQIALWIDPTATDYYNPNGTSSARFVSAWNPTVALKVYGFSFVTNYGDEVLFDNAVFASDPLTVGIGVIPEPTALGLLAPAALALTRRIRRA